MNISATIICKNEAGHIEECLASLTEVDQIVLCDTGSTDDTIAIAKRVRPDLTLAHFPWVDHFAEARNAALDAATGDWCLIIDCDEIVAPGTIESLRSAIESNPAVNTLRFLCQAKGDPSKQHYMVRAHKRTPGLRWRGRVHEALTGDSLIIAGGLGRRVAILCCSFLSAKRLYYLWRKCHSRSRRLPGIASQNPLLTRDVYLFDALDRTPHQCHTLITMKNPFKSLTIWGVVIAAVASFLEKFGVHIDLDTTNILLEEAVNAWPEILEAAGLVMAFIGRVRASKPISFTGN